MHKPMFHTCPICDATWHCNWAECPSTDEARLCGGCTDGLDHCTKTKGCLAVGGHVGDCLTPDRARAMERYLKTPEGAAMFDITMTLAKNAPRYPKAGPGPRDASAAEAPRDCVWRGGLGRDYAVTVQLVDSGARKVCCVWQWRFDLGSWCRLHEGSPLYQAILAEAVTFLSERARAVESWTAAPVTSFRKSDPPPPVPHVPSPDNGSGDGEL